MKKNIFYIIFTCQFIFNSFSIDIVQEYRESNYKIVVEEIEDRINYRVVVYDENSKFINQLNNISSSTGVWLDKLDNNHIAVYGGSFYAPDCFCYVFDFNKNQFSEKIYLPVCFDIKNELVLSLYYDEIVIFNIYDKKIKYKIPEPKDICSLVQLWDRINRDDTKLDNGILYLSYKVFLDNKKLDTYNKSTEILIKNFIENEESKNKSNLINKKNRIIHILISITVFLIVYNKVRNLGIKKPLKNPKC